MCPGAANYSRISRRVKRRTQQELIRHINDTGCNKILDQAVGCMHWVSRPAASINLLSVASHKNQLLRVAFDSQQFRYILLAQILQINL